MTYIDKMAYNSRIKTIHPLEKFIFSFISLIIVLTSTSIITCSIVFLLMSLIIFCFAGIKPSIYLKLYLIPFFFLLIGITTIAVNQVQMMDKIIYSVSIFNHQIGITHASLSKSLMVFFRSMAALSCLYFLMLTVTLLELIQILSGLKIPPLFLELMMLIYRFIFLFFDTADRIHTAQTSRLGYQTLKNRFKSSAQLVAALFITSIKRSHDLYNALESRCYTGRFNFLPPAQIFSQKNWLGIILIESALILINLLTRKMS